MFCLCLFSGRWAQAQVRVPQVRRSVQAPQRFECPLENGLRAPAAVRLPPVPLFYHAFVQPEKARAQRAQHPAQPLVELRGIVIRGPALSLPSLCLL